MKIQTRTFAAAILLGAAILGGCGSVDHPPRRAPTPTPTPTISSATVHACNDTRDLYFADQLVGSQGSATALKADANATGVDGRVRDAILAGLYQDGLPTKADVEACYELVISACRRAGWPPR